MGAVCVARKAAQGVFSFVCLFVFPFAIFISCFHFLFLAMGNSFCAVLSAACLLQRCRCEFSIAAGGKGMPSFGTRVPFGVHVHVHVF